MLPVLIPAPMGSDRQFLCLELSASCSPLVQERFSVLSPAVLVAEVTVSLPLLQDKISCVSSPMWVWGLW